MDKRMNLFSVVPDGYKMMLEFEKYVIGTSVTKTHKELIKIRASQINGCAFCLEMHTASLRAGGIPDAKLDSLAGWHVSPYFSERERAALAWTEALVDVAHSHAPDEDFERLKAQFSDAEIADLSFAIALMSAFNRLAIGMRQ